MSIIGNPLITTNYISDSFSGDASTVAFTLSQAPASDASISVYITGLYQIPTSAYTISGTTLTFTGAPPTGTNNITVLHLGVKSATLVPVNGSVTPQMLSTANVIYWSASNNNIGIGNVTPTSLLTVTGTAALGNTTITGSLTASANVNLDAGTFFVDGTNNRVGVGTTSPSYSVHVKPSSGSPVVTAEGVGTSQAGFFAAIGSDSGSYPGFRTYQGATHYWSMHQRGDTNLHLYREAGSGGVVIDSGTFDVASRGITKGSMPAGSVIQTVSSTKTDTASTASTTAVDTGLSVSITPTSASSKILIIVTINMGHSDFGVKRTYFKLAGGNSASYIGGAGASGHTDAFAVCHRAGDGYSMVTATGSYLDSPATTSAITYKLQWMVETAASTAYLNRPASEDSNGSRTASTITVMEIAQ